MYMLKIIRDELKIYFDNIKQCVYNINIRRNVLMNCNMRIPFVTQESHFVMENPTL